MKERPILFSAPMVRAILEGRKTVTRRVVKPQPVYDRSYADDGLKICGKGKNKGSAASIHCAPLVCRFCPYGQPGDRLWVRETFSGPHCMEASDASAAVSPAKWGRSSRIWYWADGNPDRGDWTRSRPSIFMPRWASRITLEVTGVRVERLQDITEDDAKREGCMAPVEPDGSVSCGRRKTAFRHLWESINGGGSWHANPWVWAVEFKRIEATA